MLTKKVWKEFCGLPKSYATRIAEESIAEMDLKLNTRDLEPTLYERVIFGSEEKTKIEVDYGGEELAVTIFDVTGDIILRIFSKISGRSIIPKLSFIVVEANSVKVLDSFLREFIPAFIARSDKPPWIIDHPRFRVSWLLRYRVKRSWTKYLSKP